MLDELQVRAFNSQERRFLKDARSEVASIGPCLKKINACLETGDNVTMALGAAKSMSRYVADLVSALSSLDTLREVRFIMDGPDAEEA